MVGKGKNKNKNRRKKYKVNQSSGDKVASSSSEEEEYDSHPESGKDKVTVGNSRIRVKGSSVRVSAITSDTHQGSGGVG